LSLSHEATNLITLMRDAADFFVARLEGCTDTVRLPPPSLPVFSGTLKWENTLFSGTKFRRGHIEIFEVPGQFSVLHGCILPHLDNAAPIFGFDMVSGQTQATGIFLDFSPVTRGQPIPALSDVVPPEARLRFARVRERPDWGSIFSTAFFAIRPTSDDEVRAAIALAQRALTHYLDRLEAAGGAGRPDREVVSGQTAYARAQRLNPHTFRMLSRYVGTDAARYFIEEILFPLPSERKEELLF